ncbi:MAG: SPOR domain-containing protein [Novosphingobium sp.]
MASLRVALGQTYMKAGRFESAITAFNDALELGDQSPRTALSLALANIAIGRNDEAVAILNDWQGQLQAADAGLAYALAGEARRGTAILTDAARSTAPTAQTRQNLAYSLALEGRWREARIVMSQDLAPELINDRIGQWAELTSAGNPRLRIAAMLGAPVRTDAGQPERLALVAPSVQPQAATPVEATTDYATLAAEAPVAPAAVLATAEPTPEAAPAPVAATQEFAAASVQPGFVSMPVIQTLPAQAAKQPRAARVARTERKPVSPVIVAANGTHVVQLGSFTSEESARRAWAVYTSRNAALRNYRMTIIPATVNGKSYWRVAAGGLDAGAARTMCGSIKSRGGSCLAYASNSPAPADRGGPQMARRR